MSEFVSILIPCYNAERWVGAAIESALAQTWPAKEVIVVDDGSTDGSRRVIESYGSAIRWESGPNRGGNRARNRLLELSQGAWLQYLDADDYLLADKIAQQMETVAAQPTADVVFSPVIVEQADQPGTPQEPLLIPEPHDPWVLLALWRLPQTGGPLWRRAALVDVGGWKPDQPCCQEHELYLRLLIAGRRFVYDKRAAAVYRQWTTGSVCTRDVPLVLRERLLIEARLESYLSEQRELTAARRQAVNEARLEMARSAWQLDRPLAREIRRALDLSDPMFVPHGPAAPARYRFLYRWLGFAGAETIADWMRPR